MQAEKLLSPETYTFQHTFLGKEINPVVLNKKWKGYLEQTYIELLKQACKATNSVAVRSTLLSRYEKEMYSNQRYHSGIKIYYLFPADAVPMNIFCKLDQAEDKVIYE